ncbi:hypothetical protein C8R45DRAFT_941353 [Mycena sanguinolenta]|nr:hypothetical protein C8R45DRAFT_941353 [Mycena sanguinolenta]
MDPQDENLGAFKTSGSSTIKAGIKAPKTNQDVKSQGGVIQVHFKSFIEEDFERGWLHSAASHPDCGPVALEEGGWIADWDTQGRPCFVRHAWYSYSRQVHTSPEVNSDEPQDIRPTDRLRFSSLELTKGSHRVRHRPYSTRLTSGLSVRVRLSTMHRRYPQRAPPSMPRRTASPLLLLKLTHRQNFFLQSTTNTTHSVTKPRMSNKTPPTAPPMPRAMAPTLELPELIELGLGLDTTISVADQERVNEIAAESVIAPFFSYQRLEALAYLNCQDISFVELARNYIGHSPGRFNELKEGVSNSRLAPAISCSVYTVGVIFQMLEVNTWGIVKGVPIVRPGIRPLSSRPWMSGLWL